MLVAGTGSFDNDTVTPLAEIEKAYNELNTDKVMMRRSDNIDHHVAGAVGRLLQPPA